MKTHHVLPLYRYAFRKAVTTLGLMPFALLVLFAATLPSQAQVDLDSDDDDLLDAWELQHFGVLNDPNGNPTDDPDGDLCNNLAESMANTNPNDPSDCLAIVDSNFNAVTAMVCWPSVRGKRYNIQISEDLSTWTTIERTAGTDLDFLGSNAEIQVDFASTPASPTVTGGLTREYWGGTGTALPLTSVDFDTHFGGLGAPDGTEWCDSTKGPSDYADQFTARYSGYLQVKSGGAGTYNFYVASRGPSEFRINSVAGGTTVPAGVDAHLYNDHVVDEEDWDYLASNGLTDTQKSAGVALAEGSRYRIDLRHVSADEFDHVAVAWEGPGTNGIEVIPAACLSPVEAFTSSNATSLLDPTNTGPTGTPAPRFARVITYGALDPATDGLNADALDADGDDVADDVENTLSGFNPFDSMSASGAVDDGDYLDLRGPADPSADVVSVNFPSADFVAREEPGFQTNGVNKRRDTAPLRIDRGGSLVSKTIFFTLDATVSDLVGESSTADYTARTTDGTELTPTGGTYAVNVPFGADSVIVEIDPVLDEIVEYPEDVTLEVQAGDYTIPGGGTEMRTIEIHDAPDEVVFEKYYIGEHSPELPASGAPDNPTGASFIILNGSNRVATIDNQYGSFAASNDEIESHVHRANLNGNTVTNGPVIHTVPPDSPGDYRQEDYLWNMNDAEGTGVSNVQERLDSLEFDNAKQFPAGRVPAPTLQGGNMPPLYINIHTDDFTAGQIWAIYRRANASTEPPASRVEPTPPVEPIDHLTEEPKLRREIRRFLTQATFGPTQQSEEELFQRIVNDHGGDRIAGYTAWLSDQWALPQTLIADLCLALDMQEWLHRGYWEAAEYESGGPPVLPTDWPNFDTQDISGFDSLDTASWRTPDVDYPLNNNVINAAKDNGTGEPNANNRRKAIWTVYLQAKDQLRQRVGFALSEIMVISAELANIDQHHIAALRYLDQLGENADDNFRECLEDVTYSPIMGKYLSHLQNTGANVTGVPADENYAREIMQLFSIGLLDLWDDGFIKLDGTTKNITQTYGNDEITALARIMTGMSWSTNSAGTTNWDTPNLDRTNPTIGWYDDNPGNKYYSSRYNYPMAFYDPNHDTDSPTAKVIAGNKTIENTVAQGTRYPSIGDSDLADVHNYFGGTQNNTTPGKTFAATWSSTASVNHQNPPAFISRRLIQRLVTSNPSSDYIYRVAQVFRTTNGDLDQVVNAILLDPEARNISDAETNIEYGKKKEPFLAYAQAVRALSGRSEITIDGSSLIHAHRNAGEISSYNPGLGTYNDLASVDYPQFSNLQGTTQYSGGSMVITGGTIQNDAPTQIRLNRTDTSTTRQLRQTPLRPPTVFNWFLPDYQPAGNIASFGLFAPEFQLADENAVIQNVNMYWQFGWNNNGEGGTANLGGSNEDQEAEGFLLTSDNLRATYEFWYDKYNNYDPADLVIPGGDDELSKDLQLVNELDDILCAGRLQLLYPFDTTDDGSDVTEGAITWPADRNVREIIAWTMHDSYGTGAGNVDEKVRLAFYLIMSTPEFLHQK
ncbi:MAG: DUF1800 family protein [Verrucomicrobiota bacterium]